MHRSVLAFLLLALATSAAAQTPPPLSIDIISDVYGNLYVRATGAFIVPAVYVDWSWEFPGTPSHAGGRWTLTRDSHDIWIDIQEPVPPVFTDIPIPGTATITYLDPGTSTPVTKSRPLLAYDYGEGISGDELHAVERSEPTEHVIPVRLYKPAAMTIIATFSKGSPSSDYTILDETLTFAPGETLGSIRVRIEPDAFVEPSETHIIGGTLRNSSGKLLAGGHAVLFISDREIRATLTADRTHVFAGDPFEMQLTLSEPVDPWPPVVLTATSSSPAVAFPADGNTIPLPVNATTLLTRWSTGRAGDATVGLAFPPSKGVSDASVDVRVYDGAIAFEGRDSVTITAGEKTEVVVQMTPPPPATVDFAIREFPGFALVGSDVLTFGPSGKVTLGLTGLKPGLTYLAVESPGKRHVADLEVRVLVPLAVKGVVPSSGRGGTNVVISGTGFIGDCTVRFGLTPATGVVVKNDTTLHAIAPAHADGNVDVTVGCGNSTQALVSAFKYAAAASRGRSVRH